MFFCCDVVDDGIWFDFVDWLFIVIVYGLCNLCSDMLDMLRYVVGVVVIYSSRGSDSGFVFLIWGFGGWGVNC